jgi:hypothetical protein
MSELDTELTAFLEELRDATARGLVRWRKAEAPDWFEAEGPVDVWIRFKYPEYAFGGSDRDLVELGVGPVSFRLAVGTVGWRLAVEVLSLGLPQEVAPPGRHVDALRQARSRLGDALGGRGPSPPGPAAGDPRPREA